MSTEIIKPHKLEAGDSILLVSPAAGLAGIESFKHRVENGITNIKKLGYQVVEGNNCRKVGARAGSIEERARDINSGVNDKSIAALIATIGGDNVCAEILSFIDFESIQKNPKIFIGYSDITALLLAIHSKTGLVTFYGPTLMAEMGEYPHVLPYTIESFNKVLTDSRPVGEVKPPTAWTDETLDWNKQLDLTRPRNLIKSTGWEWINNGSTKGKLIGGCIQTLSFLVSNYGSYLPKTDSAIFFWESSSKSVGHCYQPDEIISELNNVIKSGYIDNISGMIVGRTPHYDDKKSQDLKEKVLTIFKRFNIPILFNFPIGHTDPKYILPIGIEASIDSRINQVIINTSAVN